MDAFSLMQDLVPESFASMRVRFRILQMIANHQPIGRRSLAKELEMTERTLRTETDLLKDQKLIDIQSKGMVLTDVGAELLAQLSAQANCLITMSHLERQLASKLGVSFCRIVEETARDGHQELLNQSIGDAVQAILEQILPLGDSILAVTGGTTMASLASRFTKELSKHRSLTFVPARGGVGGSTIIQASSVSEMMASRTGGKHYSLYIPEHVSKETYLPLMQEPAISKAINLMKHANCLLYSVGDAKIMGERRGLKSEDLELIHEKKAIGEAFGCFFTASGEVVYKLPRVGLHLSDLTSIPFSVAIVTGVEKVEALKAYAKLAPRSKMWFVVDQGVANLVLSEATR